MSDWLAALEQERPNHPYQLEKAAQLDRDAWERTADMRAWRDNLRHELEDKR